jgi:hypothetical protein
MGPGDLLTLFVMFVKDTSGPFATSFSTNRLSFTAFHSGFSAADSSALYSAVQALRTALGGGYV